MDTVASAISSLTRAQRDRLSFVDLHARFVGHIGRHELIERFEIQAAAASRDLAQYRALAPVNLDYDTRAKLYRANPRFKALFDFPTSRVMSWLSQGYGDVEPGLSTGQTVGHVAALPCGNVDLETLATITRAIYSGSSIRVAYRGFSSGLTVREIAPHAIAEGAHRWHVRAFDRRSGEFRDFVLGRLSDAQPLPTALAAHEAPANDIQWNRVTELALVPHPANVRHPDTIEAEYGMEGGILRVRIRAALAGYLLRSWNVDCTDDHRLKGPEYQLWLRNPQALYGVVNLTIAPGYEPPEDRP